MIYLASLTPFCVAAFYTFYTKRDYATIKFNANILLVTLILEAVILFILMIFCLASDTFADKQTAAYHGYIKTA